MTSTRPKLRKPTQENAARAVDQLKAADPKLWAQWLELEAKGDGIMEIAPSILRFLDQIYEMSNFDQARLMGQMRMVASREAKRLQRRP